MYVTDTIYAYREGSIKESSSLMVSDATFTVCRGSFSDEEIIEFARKNDVYVYHADADVAIVTKNVTFYRRTTRDVIPIDVSYHDHFSGFVKYRSIIDRHPLTLIGDELHYGGSKMPEMMKVVEDLWQKNDQRKLGIMFFNVIKDPTFFPIYCRMIIDEMNENGIKELHLRLRLGHAGMSMQEEIDTIKLHTDGRVKIIAQYNRYAKGALEYFRKVKALNSDIIIGYDLTGKEGKMRLDHRLFREINDKPWFLHVGEGLHLIDNMKLIRKMKLDRIGHGIAAKGHRDHQIYHFELTPIGYYVNRIMTVQEIRDLFDEFIRNGVRFSISADDTNKYYDQDIQENLLFLKGIGVSVKNARSW